MNAHLHQFTVTARNQWDAFETVNLVSFCHFCRSSRVLHLIVSSRRPPAPFISQLQQCQHEHRGVVVSGEFLTLGTFSNFGSASWRLLVLFFSPPLTVISHSLRVLSMMRTWQERSLPAQSVLLQRPVQRALLCPPARKPLPRIRRAGRADRE